MAESDFRVLANALEALDDGLGIYDADDCLIAFNSRYAEVHTAIGGKAYLGARWEDLVTAGLRAGGIAEAIGHEEAWLEERRRLRGAYQTVRVLPDGRRFEVSEKRMPNGGIAAVWVPLDRPRPPAIATPAGAAPFAVQLRAAPPYDIAELREQIRWLRGQAAQAAPEHGEVYLRLAAECEILFEQTVLTPPIRN